MAGPTLCIACAQFPVKNRSLAIKTMKCADCGAEVGVTSYGATFRTETRKRRLVLSPTVLTGATIGAGLFAFVVAMKIGRAHV